MTPTPIIGAEGMILQVKVKLDGKDIDESFDIQSINVHHAINKISNAQIVLSRGWGALQITDIDDFSHGKKIDIYAGYVGSESNCIFKGIIVGYGVKLDAETGQSIIIECKHEGVKMTYKETERLFENQTDDAIIDTIIRDHNISCTVGSGSITHAYSFQKMATDWDFILSRCNFNGFIAMLDGDSGIVIDKPNVSGSPVLKIEAGDSIISFEGNLNAEFQPSSVIAAAWNPKELALMNTKAVEPEVNKQGSIKPSALPSTLSQDELKLISATPMTNEELKKWADSTLLRKRLSAFKGTVKYFGNALAKTGSIIEIVGVGKKLSGEAFVSEVTHVIDSGNWITSASFGLEKEFIHDSAGFSYPTAMHKLPAMQGLQLGTVKQIDQDPDNLYRILIEIPSVSQNPNNTWARMAHTHASNNSGSFFLPEIGDEVVFGFLDNDTRFPVILGSLYSGKNAPAYMPDEKNSIKAIVTRTKMKIEFDEDKKQIKIQTPSNNSILLNEEDKAIEIKDQHGNSIKLNSDGISINSIKDIKITAQGSITSDANHILETAKLDLILRGMNINANADLGFTAKGNAIAELSSSGQTTINGAMVMIN